MSLSQRCLGRLTKIGTLLLLSLVMESFINWESKTLVKAEDAPLGSENTTAEIPKPVKNDSASEEDVDWGSFYDPKDIFCGEFDCYKILELDYLDNPTSKEITKKFRALSRIWHPDKNRSKGAKERFVKIKKAHEILSSKTMKKEYDFFRDRPDEYFVKYGSSVLFSYAPKSDARFIIFFLFILLNVFTYAAQYQRWNQIANHVIRAAVEDWTSSQGGSKESMEVRQKALEILAKQQEEAGEENKSEKPGKKESNRQAKKMARLNKQDKKKDDQEKLRKIVEVIVHEITDFGAGFHKPTMKDLFLWKVLKFPWIMMKALAWRSKFYFRRLRGLKYSDEEIEIMTRMYVGEIAWEAVEEKERERMLKLELWVPENLEEWREEQRVKLMSSGDQKRFAREKKRNKGKKLE